MESDLSTKAPKPWEECLESLKRIAELLGYSPEEKLNSDSKGK